MSCVARLAAVLLAGTALAGCLEVEQHPAWSGGYYDGKADPRRPQAFFHGDRLAWNAHVLDRNRLQDEFLRTERPRQPRNAQQQALQRNERRESPR